MLRADPHQILSSYEQLDDDPAVRRADYRTYLVEEADCQYLLRDALDPEPICRAHRLMQSLKKRGFTNLVPIVPTTRGEPTVSGYGGEWYLQPHYPPAELNTGEELLRLARLLGSLHLCTEGEEEGSMVHGRLGPGVVRAGPSGELLLDSWDHAGPGNAADDLMPLLFMAAQQGCAVPASTLDAYASVRDLGKEERSRLNDLIARCRESRLRGLAVPEPKEKPGEMPPGDLLERALSAVEKGKWTPSREDETVSRPELNREDVDVRPTEDEVGGDPPEKEKEKLSPLRWEFPPALSAADEKGTAPDEETECCDQQEQKDDRCIPEQG